MKVIEANPGSISVDHWGTEGAKYIFVQSVDSKGQRASTCLNEDETWDLVRALVETLGGK